MKKDIENTPLDIQTLGYYIDRALCVMIKRLNKELRDENLNFQHSDYTIMRVLDETGCLNQSQIAKFLGKERSAISKSLKSLENNGYIKRAPMNGCTNSVSLTEKGKEIMPALNKIADKITDIASNGFSTKKRTEMMKNLTQIYLNCL